MSIKLDHHIPLPASGRKAFGNTSLFPFRAMNVGDSFAVPYGLHDKVSQSSAYFRKAYGIRVTVRKMPDGSYRCWRIA